MQSLKLPAVVPGRQMNLLFEDNRLDGLGALERDKIISNSGSDPHAGGGHPRRGA